MAGEIRAELLRIVRIQVALFSKLMAADEIDDFFRRKDLAERAYKIPNNTQLVWATEQKVKDLVEKYGSNGSESFLPPPFCGMKTEADKIQMALNAKYSTERNMAGPGFKNKIQFTGHPALSGDTHKFDNVSFLVPEKASIMDMTEFDKPPHERFSVDHGRRNELNNANRRITKEK
jgi:hypothetical protein